MGLKICCMFSVWSMPCFPHCFFSGILQIGPYRKWDFIFPPCIYFNIPNRATGNGWVLPYPPAGPVFPALSLLLVGFATFGYFETEINFQTHVYSKRLESTDPKPRKANRHNSNCNVILIPAILIKHLVWPKDCAFFPSAFWKHFQKYE